MFLTALVASVGIILPSTNPAADPPLTVNEVVLVGPLNTAQPTRKVGLPTDTTVDVLANRIL